MSILEQHPLLTRQPRIGCAAIGMIAGAAAAIHEGAGIEDCAGDVAYGCVGVPPKPDHLCSGPLQPPRKQKRFLTKNFHYRAGRSGAPECFEEESNAFLHLLVRVQGRLVVGIVDEANRQGTLQLATARFVQDATLQAGPQRVQLRLAHGSFETQQETIIEVRWIIDAVFIENERVRVRLPSYGRPRITEQLRRQGWKVNPKRVYRLMREDNLL